MQICLIHDIEVSFCGQHELVAKHSLCANDYASDLCDIFFDSHKRNMFPVTNCSLLLYIEQNHMTRRQWTGAIYPDNITKYDLSSTNIFTVCSIMSEPNRAKKIS